MQLSKLPKFLLWLTGTIIVGALGSGLWEIGKPVLLWFINAILDVATLGISALRDGIYEEVARGTYERAGESVLTIIVAIMAFMPAGLICGWYFSKIRWRNATEIEIAQNINIKFPKLLLTSMFLVLSLTLFVQNVRVVYIIRAANHMEQLQRVVGPYIPEMQRLIFASRFSSMHTREEYIQLVLELSDIAKNNNVHVPDFSIY